MWISEEPVVVVDESKNLKLEFVYIGEGLNGDYTEDPSDIPLLRLDIYRKDASGDWVMEESRCTLFPAFLEFDWKYKALVTAVLYLISGIEQGKSLRRLADELSYIHPDNYQKFDPPRGKVA